MAKKNMKKRLTQAEEFQIMKLVLDKFLWLGFAIMGYGLYLISAGTSIMQSFVTILVGVIVLVMFMLILIKEYEIVK